MEKKFESKLLGNERMIGVYVPPDYDPSAGPYPMLLLFDRSSYSLLVPTARILNRRPPPRVK